MAFHFLSKGLVLEQHKEPALSRDLRELIVPGSARPLPLPKAEDPAALSPEEIIAFADAAGIIDERDSLPRGEKLRAARRDGGTAMAVSYTHLDVYKRQAFGSFVIWWVMFEVTYRSARRIFPSR